MRSRIGRGKPILPPLLCALAFGCGTSEGLESDDNSRACAGLDATALEAAKQLFAAQRPSSKVTDYEVKVTAENTQILVSFMPKSLRIGDHPLVIYECASKTANFFEGE